MFILEVFSGVEEKLEVQEENSGLDIGENVT